MTPTIKTVIAVAVGAALMMATPATADTVTTVGLPGGYGPYQTGQGGEFTLQINDAVGPQLDLGAYASSTKNLAGINSFQTFCLEGNEFIYPNATYNVAISSAAYYGGNTGGPSDTVSVGTGWLYSQFASGTWAGSLSYNYALTPSRNTSADALQKAIWWLEGEEGIAYNGANVYMAAVVAQFSGEAGAKANGAELYGVYALNLSAPFCASTRCQDQLYFAGLPQNTLAVPDGGATLALLGLALSGVALAARRLRRT